MRGVSLQDSDLSIPWEVDKWCNKSFNTSFTEWVEINRAQWEDDPALSCLAFPLGGNLSTADMMMKWNATKNNSASGRFHRRSSVCTSSFITSVNPRHLSNVAICRVILIPGQWTPGTICRVLRRYFERNTFQKSFFERCLESLSLGLHLMLIYSWS